jgi:hypothetical protein
MNSDRSSRTRLGRAAAGLLSLTLLAAGCEGSNLFVGEVGEEPPQITTLTAPSSVDSGEEFDVQVVGTAPRGVRFIEVRVSGAATDSIRDEFTGTDETEFTFISITPSSAIGSQVVIDAFVQDVNGRSSSTRRVTVAVSPVTSGSRPN